MSTGRDLEVFVSALLPKRFPAFAGYSLQHGSPYIPTNEAHQVSDRVEAKVECGKRSLVSAVERAGLTKYPYTI